MINLSSISYSWASYPSLHFSSFVSTITSTKLRKVTFGPAFEILRNGVVLAEEKDFSKDSLVAFLCLSFTRPVLINHEMESRSAILRTGLELESE